MKKPLLPSAASATPEPTAFVPVGSASGGVVPSARPARQVASAPGEYVDPYLFETGFYSSRAEYEKLMRTAPNYQPGRSRSGTAPQAPAAHPKAVVALPTIH